MLTRHRMLALPAAFCQAGRFERRLTTTAVVCAAQRPTFEYEEAHWRSGRAFVAGVDEAGRGALAGPVVAAACVLSPEAPIEDIRDSKMLSEQRREHLFEKILDRCLAYGMYATDGGHDCQFCRSCTVGADVIDRENILRATLLAMTGAVVDLERRREGISLDAVLVDGNAAPTGLRHEIQTLIRGDARSLTIAAASILAKVTGDRLMRNYGLSYPEYGFERHKGYGTQAHMEAIRQFGPCPLHRMTFRPMRDNQWKLA